MDEEGVLCDRCDLYPWSYICEACGNVLCGNATCSDVLECTDTSLLVHFVCEECLFCVHVVYDQRTAG